MLKVVTFNLRYNDDENGHSVAERAPRLRRVLSGYDADLMGFQEATPKWMELLRRDYGEAYDFFTKCRDEEAREAAPVFWKKDRFECVDKGYFWLSDTPDVPSLGYDAWGCCRICTWVTLRDKKKSGVFTYLNTHFGFGDREQMLSVKLVLDRISRIAGDRVILTGDLNMHMGTQSYQELAKHLVDVNMATVRDLRPTYHDYDIHRADPESRIDFCFISRETLRAITSRRMDEMVDGKFPSDHYGVYSEIGWE